MWDGEHYRVNKERNNSGPRPDRVCLKSSQSRGWGIKRPRPLWATYWNPVSKRKDGRGKNWRGEREGNGGGEELFSKCTKHRRLYFLQKHGSNKIMCGPFLFQSSRMFFIFLTRPPLHSSSLTQSTAQAPFSEAIFYSGILFPVRRPDLLPCVLSIEYSGRGKSLLSYTRVPSLESDRNHVQRTLSETLQHTFLQPSWICRILSSVPASFIWSKLRKTEVPYPSFNPVSSSEAGSCKLSLYSK